MGTIEREEKGVVWKKWMSGSSFAGEKLWERGSSGTKQFVICHDTTVWVWKMK